MREDFVIKMRTLYIEARKKFDESEIDFSRLDDIAGEKISVAATVQYLDLIPVVKKYLEGKGKNVVVKRGVCYDGHVLGCKPFAFDKNADALLLITDGKFHAMNNAILLGREIYVFDTKNLEKIGKKEIENYKKNTETKKKIFLSADAVGLILSEKFGQKNREINSVKEKIEKLGKKVFIFEGDNIDPCEFENFPQIKIWINTACFGLAHDDKRILNLGDVAEFLK
jgi:diphthamide biosynthesis enzyme Dph1/Dph2-like protein